MKNSAVKRAKYDYNKNAFKIDKILIFELLPLVVPATITLEIGFKYLNDKKKYWNIYKFNVIENGERKQVWMTKDECKNNFDKQNIA